MVRKHLSKNYFFIYVPDKVICCAVHKETSKTTVNANKRSFHLKQTKVAEISLFVCLVSFSVLRIISRSNSPLPRH